MPACSQFIIVFNCKIKVIILLSYFGFLVEVDACMQPVHRGMCLAAHRRFYYDAATGKCQEFVYGGCGGNRNRFDSLRECEQTCGQPSGNMFWKKNKVVAHFPRGMVPG